MTFHLDVTPEIADRQFLSVWPRSSGGPQSDEYWHRIAPGVFQKSSDVGYRPGVLVVDTARMRANPTGGTDVTYERTWRTLIAGPLLFPVARVFWDSLFRSWHRKTEGYFAQSSREVS